MNEELEQLQQIGAQKIHEQTHIPFLTVQTIIHGSYDSFSRIQFLGFISILEREYKIELTSFKEEALAYFNEEPQEQEGIFVVTPKRPKKNFLLFFALLIFMIAIGYKIFIVREHKTPLLEDIPQIERLKKRVIKVEPKIEANSTKELEKKVLEVTPKLDENRTKEIKKEVLQPTPKPIIKSEPKLVLKSLKIKSKSKVWLGYIDVKTNKKYQTVFKGEKELDPEKTWLLLFGHGFINLYVDGKVQKFSSHPIRFLYKNGNLRSITKREFNRINRGQKW